MQKAVIIIPTYNERANITPVIAQLSQVFKECAREKLQWQLSILVVDDTSPDKTYEVVRALAKKYPFVHLLLNKQKAGLGGAYLKGMQYAFDKLDADAVFEFDADMSHDPKKIPAFLRALDAGNDMVLGSRYIAGGGIPANWGWHRKFLSVVGNLFINVILTTWVVRDWTTGYRALTREVYEKVSPRLSSKRFSGYTFQIGFLHAALRQGFTVAEVPFVFVDRTHGQSKLGPEYIKNTLLFIFKTRAQELLQQRVVRFALVGGFGALVQLASLQLYRVLLPDFQLFVLTQYLLATLLSIETAIVSNFILNNGWTFSDRKLALASIPQKFLAFNAASLGSLGIQMLVAGVGERAIGLFALFTLPFVGLVIDTGLVYAVLGILIGMIWNFFAYSRFIWKAQS